MPRPSPTSLVDRIIIVAVSVFLVVLSVACAVSVMGWEGVGSLIAIAVHLHTHRIEAMVAAVALLLAGLHLLFFAFQKEGEDGIRQETEIGHVRISMRALEALVHRATRDVRGIRAVDVRVRRSPEGVAVMLTLVVDPEVQIPRISEEVGYRVRNQVKETVGIDVGDVSIEIRSIASDARARVE